MNDNNTKDTRETLSERLVRLQQMREDARCLRNSAVRTVVVCNQEMNTIRSKLVALDRADLRASRQTATARGRQKGRRKANA